MTQTITSNDNCPKCETKLIVGFAIDPGRAARCCFGIATAARITAENLTFVFVMKCPKCGHCEETDQNDPRFNPPSNYRTWNDYWRAL